MRRLSWVLLLGVLVLLSVPALWAQPDSPASTLQVIDSAPLAGEELTGAEPITLYFNQPVDCATAQAAFTIQPALDGGLTCADDGYSITFTPGADYARATTYRVTLAAALRAADGAALADAVTFAFQTGGDLAVNEVLPADGAAGVEVDSVITVIFNRPVVPLVIAEEEDTLPDPLRFDPPVEGEGRWLNTSIYQFRPAPALAGGAEYTVTVEAGLTAVDGATLPAAFRWSFVTVDPAIIETTPRTTDSGVALDMPIIVQFNQPMDRASVEAGFYLRPADDEEGTIGGAFTWTDDDARVAFQPDALLELDTFYAAGITGARSALGTAGLTGETEWEFLTVPRPAITGTTPFDGQADAQPYDSFTIYFASPMNRSTLRDKITIEPEPWREADAFYYEWENSYNLSFPTEPSTDYTITIAPGMEDIYGNRIERGLVVRYSTAPYNPDVNLQAPSPVGFYNAYADQTQVFLTHRNVSQIDLQLYRIETDEFVDALNSGQIWDLDMQIDAAARSLLREWVIAADVPLNQRRYELLQLGGDMAGIECPGAPVSRLKVGDSAIVIAGPEALRARAAPVDGEVVDLLYRDYRLSIVGGPVCANDLVWWEVTLRDSQTAWVAEGDPEEYYLDLLSPGAATTVDLASGLGEAALPPGIYALRYSAPEVRAASNYDPGPHFMVVASANLTIKSMADGVLVWATDAQTGRPIAGASIDIYQRDDGLVGGGVTDADGLLRLETPRLFDLYVPRVAVLRGEGQFGIATTDWTDGIEPYMFGLNFSFAAERYRAYLYTDRPVYRPDQPVYFRGVLRLREDVAYFPPDRETVPVKIYNERGEVVYEETLPLTPFGTFSGEFPIADDAPLGFYRIEVDVTPAERTYPFEGGSVAFLVAEYRVPEFQVALTPAEDAVVQNATIQVLVESSYFFGGLVSDAVVEYSARIEPYTFDYRGPGRYSFEDFDFDAGPGEFYGFYGQEIASGEGRTDAEGRFMIEIPADLEDSSRSVQLTVEATVRDESGLTVSGRAPVVIHKGLIYIGAAPESYVSTAGQETIVDLIAVDWDSAGVAGQEIAVEVVERRWSSVQEEDPAGRTIWTWEVEEIPVADGSVTTGADGRASYAFTPPNGGIFKVKISTRDAEGNPVIAAATVWAAGPEYVSWRQQNSNRIDLIADKNDYEVGETAEILITSPFQGAVDALITVERGDVLSVEQVTLDSNSFVYRLPITEDFAPNIYVSVLLVKGVDESNPVAAFRMGLIQLGVDNARKAITITATPDREQAGPRETVTYTIETTDYAGEPLAAEVGLGFTDLATLSIGEPNSPNILSYFYGQQGLGVRTATPLTINTDQITQTVLDTIKGGGGGGGEGGIFDIREEFVDTPYWNPTLTTGPDGRATVSITLPDNLTTWRLDARAITLATDGEMRVGQATFDLLSTKPLLIRPVTPRFFVVDDAVVLAAIVNNNTDQTIEAEVFIEGGGYTLQAEAVQTVRIPAGGRVRVEWPLIVSDVESIDLTFFADGGAFTDASRPPLGQGADRLLPVYRYEVPETVGTGGLLREGGARTESIPLPARFDVEAATMTVNLDPSLAATTLDGLTYLENFPHQCIEQTISRFLPNIMTYRALAALDVADPELEANLNRAVNFGLQRLYAQQKPNGGWGWFVQDESNPLTTAYALIGLSAAREGGFAVDEGVIERAQSFLRRSFVAVGADQPAWRLNRQAFILYALATSGAPDIARTTNLYEARERLDHYARAFLAQTLYLIDPADTSRTDVLISDLLNRAVFSANGIHWEEERPDVWNWNTDTRSTAIILQTLARLRPDSDLLPNVVRWLMMARSADAWESTQETAWAVMALTDWMVITGELNPAYTYAASLNGASIIEGEAAPATVRDSQRLVVAIGDLLRDQANTLVIERGDGPGVLYYTAYLTAALPVLEVEPLNRGLIVERRYVNPATGAPVTEARVGELIEVRLTIIAPNDLHYAVIEDPLPAGAQGVNPQLATEQQIGTQPGLDTSDPLSQGWGWWWFSSIEFRDEKVVLYSTYLPAGTYEYVYSMRAGLPGTYNVIPTTGYQFYLPEVYGRGAGSTFTITPAEE